MTQSAPWTLSPALAALLARGGDPLGRRPWRQPAAEQILRARYFARGPGGAPSETVDAMLQRVARHVARAEGALRQRATAQFVALMRAGALLPNSPTLMNAGSPTGQLAACFVLPVRRDAGALEETLGHLRRVQQTGGGTGFSFSQLPANLAGGGGSSPGPLGALDAFDEATETVRQSGRRRGANMGVLRVDHPDICAFITAKTDPARLSNFNLSVALPASFWPAYERDETIALRDPVTGATTGHLRARRLLRLMARAAWLSAEPGLLFLDTINRDNPTPALGQIAATNPCGEQPLLDWESCTLGSLNLAWFLRDPVPLAPPAGRVAPDGVRPPPPAPRLSLDAPQPDARALRAAAARARRALARLDFAALGEAVFWAVRLLDDVLETTAFPLEPVAEASRATRKIGLGVMGFADLLIGLGLPYDSLEAQAVAEDVMGFVAAEARRASEALAIERGPFPAFSSTPEAAQGRPPRRNATLTSIAPTGTLSLLCDCSAGIEPLYAPVYRRRMLEGAEVRLAHPALQAALAARGLATDALLARMAEHGTARVPGVPEDLARLFVSAHEVPPEHHVAMQAAFQRHVDSGVSKTVNLPAEASPEQVLRLFELAHRLGCKGITVYRDGSRPGQVLRTGHAEGLAAMDASARRAAPPADSGPCPDCGAPLEPMGPFRVCHRCAWSG